MAWSRRAILIYPTAGLTDTHKDALAQAFVTHAALETFANERLMFDKAAAVSGDYGATTTHRQISTALTPALAAAMETALTGITGFWYLLDADTEALIDTNDPAKASHGLDWTPGVAVALNEILRYQGTLYQCVQAHTTQADWRPDIVPALFKRYSAPGEVSEWRQPQGAHDAYPVGARVRFNGDTWINTIPANVWQPGVTGWTNQTTPQTAAWAAGVLYRVNDEVTYAGLRYRCRQQHTSIVTWEPPNVLALWLPI